MGEGLFGCESAESFVANQRAKAPARLSEDFEVEKIWCLSVRVNLTLLIGVAIHLPHVLSNAR